MENEKIRPVLEQALAMLNGGKNWIKGSYATPTRDGVSYCSMGAVRVAARGMLGEDRNRWERIAVLDEAGRVLQRSFQEVLSDRLDDFANFDVADFNDHEKTTFTEVEQAFEKAIANL